MMPVAAALAEGSHRRRFESVFPAFEHIWHLTCFGKPLQRMAYLGISC
jgi:hypothetical protein